MQLERSRETLRAHGEHSIRYFRGPSRHGDIGVSSESTGRACGPANVRAMSFSPRIMVAVGLVVAEMGSSVAQ
jgi:hypothetical protein